MQAVVGTLLRTEEPPRSFLQRKRQRGPRRLRFAGRSPDVYRSRPRDAHAFDSRYRCASAIESCQTVLVHAGRNPSRSLIAMIGALTGLLFVRM